MQDHWSDTLTRLLPPQMLTDFWAFLVEHFEHFLLFFTFPTSAIACKTFFCEINMLIVSWMVKLEEQTSKISCSFSLPHTFPYIEQIKCVFNNDFIVNTWQYHCGYLGCVCISAGDYLQDIVFSLTLPHQPLYNHNHSFACLRFNLTHTSEQCLTFSASSSSSIIIIINL